MFIRDLVGLVRIGSAIWYQIGPLMKVIPYGIVPEYLSWALIGDGRVLECSVKDECLCANLA